MKKCSDNCIPCCDFCAYVEHEMFEDETGIHNGEPIGCSLYLDNEHQNIAEGCGYCDDFHCFRAND